MKEETKETAQRIRPALGPARTRQPCRAARSVNFDWAKWSRSAKAEPGNADEVDELAADICSLLPPASPVVIPPPARPAQAHDLAGTSRCKRCGHPIIWGQVDYDSEDPTNRRWIPLDADLFPHGCRRTQMLLHEEPTA